MLSYEQVKDLIDHVQANPLIKDVLESQLVLKSMHRHKLQDLLKPRPWVLPGKNTTMRV